MAENLEGMLAQALIDATERTSAHRLLDQMQVSLIREEAHLAHRQNAMHTDRIFNLENKVNKTEAELRQSNAEKMALNKKVRDAMKDAKFNEDLNNEWIKLLRKPLSEIAKYSASFADNYNTEKYENAKVYMQMLVNKYASEQLAVENGMSEEEYLALKYKIERSIITGDLEDDFKMVNHPTLMEFKENLVIDYKERLEKTKDTVKKMNKTSKKFK